MDGRDESGKRNHLAKEKGQKIMEERMKKILVIEDEQYLQRSIRELLEGHGYKAMAAYGVSDAMQYLLNKEDIDLFLLDVWLPDGDGFELCRSIRKYSLKPIIFLTACDDEESVVKGLNLGGDDYVSKPFRAAELISRIQANLRRQEIRDTVKIQRSGALKIDKTQGRAYKEERELELGTIEYQLLLIMMENPRRIVKRERIFERIWEESGKYAEDNTLSVSMSRLRKKIGPEYIETIRGVGYRFTKQVEESLE